MGLGVSAGGWGNQDASNCALAFGTFAFAGVPAHEMPTIAFSNPAQTNQLSWVLKNEDDDWRWGYRLGEAMTCSVSLCIWETEYEGNPLWLPRIGYHDEFEQAFYVARSYVEENQIRWDTHRVNFTGSPGTGYYTNVAMAFEAGYELIFASCYNLALNRAELGIENLLNPDSYFLHQVPPADGGRYLSMGLVRVGGNDKAALSLVKDGNLYVSVME